MSGKRRGASERGGYVTRNSFPGREFTKAEQRRIASQIALYLTPRREAGFDGSEEIRCYDAGDLSRAII